MSTTYIANTIAFLQRSTIREMLEHVGISVAHSEIIDKMAMVKLFEDAITDIGIEYLLAKSSQQVLCRIADYLHVLPYRKCIAHKIGSISVDVFLQQADTNLLVDISEALGLFKSPDRYSAVAEIGEAIIFCGVREIIGKLFSTPILNKVCLEFRLINALTQNEKEYLVHRLLCKLDA